MIENELENVCEKHGSKREMSSASRNELPKIFTGDIFDVLLYMDAR